MDYKEWEKRFLEKLEDRVYEKRKRRETVKLREILVLIEGETEMPDNHKDFTGILPNSVFRMNICFMAEEETWINTYAAHPILMPWYDCPVAYIQPDEKNTLNIWLKYKDFLEKGMV